VTVTDDSPSNDVGEIDALRWYVWGMVGVSVVAAGFIWWIQRQTETLRTTLNGATNALTEIADGKNEIAAMLAVYKRNKEDEARDQPLTWFQARWKTKGIEDNRVQLDAWKVPPDIGPDGSYVEEKIGLKFSSKNPMRRDQIGQLLHEIEFRSTRMRILTLQVRRAGREETLDKDEWTGQCEVGYRYPNVKD